MQSIEVVRLAAANVLSCHVRSFVERMWLVWLILRPLSVSRL